MDDSANMLIRLVDFLRRSGATGFFVNLTGTTELETSDEGMSSIVDTWLLVRDIETEGERNRALYILKSRGMAHSNQVREFIISSEGVKLVTPYLGRGKVLTGSARLNQEAADEIERITVADELQRKRLAMEHRRKAVESQIAALRSNLVADEEEFSRFSHAAERELKQTTTDRQAMAISRRSTNGRNNHRS
jgi:circadian clock protein KaiC